MIDLIETEGPQDLPPKFVGFIEGRLWELRLKAKSGIARTLYFTINPRRVIIVSAFVKKTQKLPQRELDKARSRMMKKLAAEATGKKGLQR